MARYMGMKGNLAPSSLSQCLARTPKMPSPIHRLPKTLQNVNSLFQVLHSLRVIELRIEVLSDSALLPTRVARDCFSFLLSSS